MPIKNEFCQIFEYELKRKLSERENTTIGEIRLLLNSFKFYDLDYIGIVDKAHWVRSILKTGLTGFNENDLFSIFPYYDPNNSGFIDYRNFSNYLYGREKLHPLPKLPNIDAFEPFNNISINNNKYINNVPTNNIIPNNNKININKNTSLLSLISISIRICFFYKFKYLYSYNFQIFCGRTIIDRFMVSLF